MTPDRPGRSRSTDPSPAAVLDTAVDHALDTLTAGRADAGGRALGTLRGALAVIAARGALCTMPVAVRTLHEAQRLLLDGDRQAAAARLTEAKKLLTVGEPGMPLQRHTPGTSRLVAR
jgi:hypothetical protein